MQQQQPHLQAQPTNLNPSTLHDDPNTAANDRCAPEPRVSIPSSQQKPRDTPSVESFTPSQLGDDERSEESERTSQEQPAKSATSFGSHSLSEAKDQPTKISTTLGESAPVFLQGTPSADSYVGSPNGIHTPRSATSSNSTPTQASFAEQSQLANSQEKAGAPESIARLLKPVSPQQSRLFSQAPYHSNNQGSGSAYRQGPMSNSDQGRSNDSRNLSENAVSERDQRSIALRNGQPRIPQNEKAKQQVRMHTDGRREAGPASHMPLQQPQDPGNDDRQLSEKPPLSLPEPSSQAARSSNEYVQRVPNYDSTSRNFNQLQLPLSAPQQTTVQDLVEQRGRPGPVHYGIGYDFIPGNDHRSNRDRSPSDPGAIQKRLSQGSRRSLHPTTFTDSAFWQGDEHRGETAGPVNFDAGPVPRDGGLRQRSPAEQERPAYSDAASGRRSESKPRSRRGSKSSAFFKSFSRSSEADQPPLPDTSDLPDNNMPLQSLITGDRKSSRTSILRSLKRTSGSWSGSGRSKENATPTTSPSQYPQPGPGYQAISKHVKDNSHSNDSPGTSKPGRKLRRASTSMEQDNSRKKRFSTIGVSELAAFS